MFDSTLRKSIIASIIASIIVILFIKPIVSVMWNVLMWFGTYVYQGITNSIYTNAALGNRNWYSFTLLSFFILFITTIMITVGLKTIIKTPKKRNIDKYSNKVRVILSILLTIFTIGAILGGIMMLITAYTDLQLNTSFQQRLTVLEPVIGDLKCKELKASWALMVSREDFLSICREMDRLANEHDVRLPSLLLD